MTFSNDGVILVLQGQGGLLAVVRAEQDRIRAIAFWLPRSFTNSCGRDSISKRC